MSIFSERLRELREKRHLTQQEAALQLKIPYRSYRRYEADESYPTVPTILQIADYYQVSTDYLLGRRDD